MLISTLGVRPSPFEKLRYDAPMIANKRRNFTGAFRGRRSSAGAWCLTQALPRPIEVHLRIAPAHLPAALDAELKDVGIEWRADSTVLSMLLGDRLMTFQAASAIVHEPVSGLYENLPLGVFDAAARRFWRRVFFLIRLPGGRRLLKLWAGR
jgi:hypothetical protein